LSSKKVKANTMIGVNPRLLTIYELLRGYKVSEKKATLLATELFNKLPAESRVPTKHEIDDFFKNRK